MDKLTIAILFGGCSEEHDISIKSAREVAEHINTEKYNPVYVGITKSGVWKICEAPGPDWENRQCRPAALSPDRSIRGLFVFHGNKVQTVPIDVVFPVLHGKTGEDGAIQGLLELSGISYVGCGVQSSAVCMDKSLAYITVRNAGIGAPEFWVLQPGESPNTKVSEYPVFVKPARSGSSFGVTKVNQERELSRAVKEARRYDDKVLIERSVSGLEVGCAVLGNGHALTVGEVDQIRLARGFFRIHQESKPEEGSENASVTVPADLPPETRANIRETAKTIYQALGCQGLARVDLFLQNDGRIILNEVNTLPGFTSYSRYPRMMAAAGLPLSEVIDRCIMLSLKG